MLQIYTVLGSPLGWAWVLSLFAVALLTVILRRIAVERAAPDEEAARKERRAARRKMRRAKRRNPCALCDYYIEENNTCQSKKCATGGPGTVGLLDRLFCKPRQVKARRK